MANLPRFGRARQRQLAAAPPVPAAARPTSEPKPEILPFAPTTQTLQPLEPNSPPPPASPPRESPRRLSSPAKKLASPKYGDTVARVASPPPLKAGKSPPASPADKYSDRRHYETTPPHSPAKSRRTTTPPLSPLALPRTQVAQPRISPEVEQKSVVYDKTVKKPAKSDRPSEYISDSAKPHQKPPVEVINLTGHNVGAVMEINQSSGKHLGGEIIKKNETEGGGVRHGNEEKKKKTAAKNEPPVASFMNSNFQSVNNSLLYDSSCSHRDPGLHLAFADAADDDGATVDGHKNYKP